MKRFTDLIKENYEDFIANNVKVTYIAEDKELVFQVPKGYSESDIQIYIGDVLFAKLPADKNIGQKYFGKNIDSISDAYFEYDAFVPLKSDEEVEDPFQWDAQKDSDEKAPELIQAKIVNLRYIIVFDTFVIKKQGSQNTKNVLDKIFATAESSAVNKYPIVIKYDKDKLEFTEQ